MKKAYVIGIAGGSASGKSTFSNSLEEALFGRRVAVFHMDSYFKPRDERPRAQAPLSRKMYIDDNHPQTADLPKLAADIAAAACGGEYEIVIVEGLLTLWDKDILAQLDLRLFIDCRPDERIVRRLRRNMKRGLSFDEISDVYLDLVRYRHDEYVEPSKWRADIILNGSNPSPAALDAVVALINTKL